MGATDVIDVKCRIAGSAGGKTTIRASLHIRTVTFDDEEWKIITLMCSYMAGYKTLFAPSCGSVGDFTDIQQDAEGNLAITSEMQCYSERMKSHQHCRRIASPNGTPHINTHKKSPQNF